jgi:hypothetical protein
MIDMTNRYELFHPNDKNKKISKWFSKISGTPIIFGAWQSWMAWISWIPIFSL